MNKVIHIEHLSKSFGDLDVLKDASLDVYEGENVVVLGRSGTGKSVLIKIIAGLLPADEGTVEVLGQDISRLDKRELNALRLQIGFSFQHSALYDSMTVRENLEFPLVRNVKSIRRTEIDRRVNEVLDSVGLLPAIDQLPAELSGGQKKRIGIARTLIMNPRIMLYDEPTAGLDPITCIEINQLINQVKERYNTSAIIITHDLTCARETGDRIAVLLDGNFKYQGTFGEVFRSGDPVIKNFYDYNFVEE